MRAKAAIAGWLAYQAGVERVNVQWGAVTLIQRFGNALNLNVHFLMLWLDGVYEEKVEPPQCKPSLHRTRVPTSAQLTDLADKIANRVCRHLAQMLEGEEESVFQTGSAGGNDGMDALRMSSITGFKLNADGGIEIYVSATEPADVPDENWLPINREDLGINGMFRVYAPVFRQLASFLSVQLGNQSTKLDGTWEFSNESERLYETPWRLMRSGCCMTIRRPLAWRSALKLR